MTRDQTCLLRGTVPSDSGSDQAFYIYMYKHIIVTFYGNQTYL